jgi:hypothetical protein
MTEWDNGLIARGPALSTLQHLVEYAGALEGAESAFGALGIERVGLERLGELPHLETLSLESCRDLIRLDSLLSLEAVRIHVRGRGRFAMKMRELAGDAPNWEFH